MSRRCEGATRDETVLKTPLLFNATGEVKTPPLPPLPNRERITSWWHYYCIFEACDRKCMILYIALFEGRGGGGATLGPSSDYCCLTTWLH